MMDNARHNTTDIVITVLDVNDNYPIFNRAEYNISINETTPLHIVTILTVTAIDRDKVCDLNYNYIINLFSQVIFISSIVYDN